MTEIDLCSIQKVDEKKEFVMLGQGNTAEIYQFEEGKILKLFREQFPFTPIQMEYQKSVLVQEKLNNVPKALELLQYHNRYGIVYEQILGKDMISSFLKHPMNLKGNSKQFAQIHIHMHQNDVDVQFSVKDKLKYDIDGATELTEEEKEVIKAYLSTLPEKTKLCHFDFHPGNIMMCEQQPMIIDWMTACTGDPCADVCRTRLLMQMGEMMHMNPILRRVIHILMMKIGKEYVKEYKSLSGISENEIQRWRLPIAAGRLAEWLTPHERKKLLRLVKKELKMLSTVEGKTE